METASKIKIGRKVKLNIVELENTNWAGLTPVYGQKAFPINYKRHILDQRDIAYPIADIVTTEEGTSYYLGDSLLIKVPFKENQLIVLNDYSFSKELLVLESHLEDVQSLLNDFFASPISFTHDWLRFPDKKDKCFEELEFVDYNEHKIPASLNWKIDTYLGQPALILEQTTLPNLIFAIEVGQIVRISEKQLFLVDSELSRSSDKGRSLVSRFEKRN